MNKDKLFLKFQNLMDPNDSSGAALSDEEFIGETSDTNNEEENNEEENNTDNEEDTNEETDNEEEDDTENDEGQDEESEEEDEEDDEDENPEEPDQKQAATFKNIKEKYPNLFKEFPELEKSFGIVKRYETHFATPEEAKEAAETLESLGPVINELELGNPTALLEQLVDNKDAIIAFSKNILPALNKLHPDLFYNASLPVLAAALRNAVKVADKDPNTPFNKNLKLAAKYISKFVFDSEEIPDYRTKQNEVDPEKAKLIKEREDFLKTRYTEFTGDINTSVESELNKLITSELKTIKGLNLSDYIKKNVTRDIFKKIDDELNQDSNFIASIRGLLKKAEKSGFTDKALSSRIKSMFLERGKGRVSKLTRSVLRAEKLISSKNDVKKGLRDAGSGNRGQSGKNRNINPEQVDYKSTSDLDLLNDNIKIKGQK